MTPLVANSKRAIRSKEEVAADAWMLTPLVEVCADLNRCILQDGREISLKTVSMSDDDASRLKRLSFSPYLILNKATGLPFAYRRFWRSTRRRAKDAYGAFRLPFPCLALTCVAQGKRLRGDGIDASVYTKPLTAKFSDQSAAISYTAVLHRLATNMTSDQWQRTVDAVIDRVTGVDTTFMNLLGEELKKDKEPHVY
jgi:hypothetical protein